MVGTTKYHSEWGNPITKEHTWSVLTDKWILAQKLGIPKIQFTDHMKLKMKEDQSVDASVLLRMGNKYESKYGDKVWSRDWRKGHTETAPPGDPSHIQLPNQDTLVDANKFLLTGTWYSYLLRVSASSWQIESWMLTANHWTMHGVPNGGARERTKGAEGVCNSIGRTTI